MQATTANTSRPAAPPPTPSGPPRDTNVPTRWRVAPAGWLVLACVVTWAVLIALVVAAAQWL